MAGLSTLYPVALSGTPVYGSVSGKVTFTDGTPVNLAAVVAIPPAGDAISAMTLPNGTFEIDGIPPGFYYVYAQSLPPALLGEKTNMGIIYPLAADGVTAVPPGCTGARDRARLLLSDHFLSQHQQLASAGQKFRYLPAIPRTGINLQVAPRNFVSVSSVRSYGYVPGGGVVEAPPVSAEGRARP